MANNNIFIAVDGDCKDPIILAGCHHKILAHPGAQIYTPKTIANCSWDLSGQSWKLHVIAHGSPVDTPTKTSGEVPGTSAKDIADCVLASKLPNKPGAQVRIDCCFGGRGGSASLASEVKSWLVLSKQGGHIEVVGVPGANVLGYGTDPKKPGGRVVVDPKDWDKSGSAQAKADKLWEDATKDPATASDWNAAEKKARSADASMTSLQLQAIAAKVHMKAKGTLKKFCKDLLDKDTASKSAGTGAILLDKSKKEHKKPF